MDPSVESYSKAFGYTLFGFDTALGGVQFSRTIGFDQYWNNQARGYSFASESTDNIFSGHGAFHPQNGFLEVPEGTSVTTWTAHGNTITDNLGNYIETGKNIHFSEFGSEIIGAQSYLQGSMMPNYTLYPPHGLNVMGNPSIVSSPTNLDILLKPNMGNVKWAACQEIVP